MSPETPHPDPPPQGGRDPYRKRAKIRRGTQPRPPTLTLPTRESRDPDNSGSPARGEGPLPTELEGWKVGSSSIKAHSKGSSIFAGSPPPPCPPPEGEGQLE